MALRREMEEEDDLLDRRLPREDMRGRGDDDRSRRDRERDGRRSIDREMMASDHSRMYGGRGGSREAGERDSRERERERERDMHREREMLEREAREWEHYEMRERESRDGREHDRERERDRERDLREREMREREMRERDARSSGGRSGSNGGGNPHGGRNGRDDSRERDRERDRDREREDMRERERYYAAAAAAAAAAGMALPGGMHSLMAFPHMVDPSMAAAAAAAATAGMSTKRNELCRDHRSGRCTRGARCPFIHGDEEKRELCRDHQRGRCPRGDSCPFIHAPAGLAGMPLAALGVPPIHSTYPSGGYSGGGRSHDGKEVCRDYSRGNCKRGPSCPYYHPPTPSSMNPTGLLPAPAAAYYSAALAYPSLIGQAIGAPTMPPTAPSQPPLTSQKVPPLPSLLILFHSVPSLLLRFNFIVFVLFFTIIIFNKQSIATVRSHRLYQIVGWDARRRSPSLPP